MGPASVLFDQVDEGTHLTDQKDVQRIVGSDAKSAGKIIGIAIHPGEYQGVFFVEIKIDLALHEQTNGKIGDEVFRAKIRARLPAVVNHPDGRFVRYGADTYH